MSAAIAVDMRMVLMDLRSVILWGNSTGTQSSK